ncbi:MAG: S53 family peptidase [Bryobacteraceae bacterium]|jgi:kumamolisin
MAFDPAKNRRSAAGGAQRMGPAKPDDRVSVTVCVRRRNGAALPDPLQLFAKPPRERTFLSRDKFTATYGAAPEDLAKVVSFGASHGLVEKERCIARRMVVLSGTVESVSAAFDLPLYEYECPNGERYRGHDDRDSIHLPDDLTDVVEGVFGLDTRKMPRARAAVGDLSAPSPAPLTPPWAARNYNFPATATGGAGQTIGLLEFGNSYNAGDIRQFFAGLGLPAPALVSVNVDGATPSSDSPDSEVTLDIAVAGSIAPGAKIVVYFAPSTEPGWVQAVGAAVHDTANAPSVISISWGGPELQSNGDFAWTPAAMQKISALFQEAAHLGITVLAATGDQGSSCGMPDHKAHVWYPASDPWVTACGGTMLQDGPPDGLQDGGEFTEVAWKDAGGATGGGISAIFPVPAWQETAGVPVSANPSAHSGRGTPDVAGYAAGYTIVFNGAPSPAPGTSGVAPLWAGLVALANETLGHRLGFLNPDLYGGINAGGGLRGVTGGDNGFDETAPFYQAERVWNACTGLGSPDGMKIIAALSG